MYDSAQWAVVFKYSTVDITDGCKVTFKNHPSGAPVVWLVQDRVIIAGTVDLSGDDGHAAGEIPFYAEPGPGGFSGAIAQSAGAGGFGPGGGRPGASASYATAGWGNPEDSVYGNARALPLVGGSGGGRGPNGGGRGAGAGGGALLIANGRAASPATSRITIAPTAVIRANGGNPYWESDGGSGGAIRLVAETVEGAGRLEAVGGGYYGGQGRIRIEATNDFVTNCAPECSFGTPPGPVFPPASVPTLRVAQIDHVDVPADPAAGIVTSDVEIQNSQTVGIRIEARNIPEGTLVTVLIVPVRGPVIEVLSSPLKDSGGGLLTAIASATFPPGRAEIQLRADW